RGVFFVQAEDGIRDFHVTGVQTCALPIWVLSLVSDAIVPGDVQILGDGTPIVLMRDHQPTGGYPRIATLVSADLDRFAQLRPGTPVRFEPVTLARAHAIPAGRWRASISTRTWARASATTTQSG